VRADTPAIGPGGSLGGLNACQQEAATYTGGPLLVVAGPGTGKTRFLAHRIAHRIVDDGVAPESILALTFTNQAAAELRERTRVLAGADAKIRAGTFHWMCHGLLRRQSRMLGYRSGFRLLSPWEAREALRATLERRDERLPVRVAAAALGAWKNGSGLADEANRCGVEERLLAAIAADYEAALRASGVMDLDDLLVKSVRLLRENEDVRRRCQLPTAELLVDEYQDTNPVQQDLLRLLAPIDGRIVAVGDPDQAIYAWRQAGSGTVRRFLADFPQARVIALEENYRSTKHILRAASALIGHNRDRVDIRLRTENPAGTRAVCGVARDDRDQSLWIARELRTIVGAGRFAFDECAVLYRTNAQSRAIEDALVGEGIPHHILSGKRFYDRAEIRTVVAYMRLALDTRDDSAAAFVLGRVPGVGDATIGAMRESMTGAQMPLSSVLLESRLELPLPARVREGVRRTGALAARVVAVRRLAPGRVVEEAVAATEASLDDTPDPIDREATLEELAEFRAAVRELDDRTTLREMVQRLSREKDGAGAGARVSLMTLHAAKGLEFPVIFIAGLEEGLLPHRRALESAEGIEEERRLCYVGMTRARSLLYLSYARARPATEVTRERAPSRFLAEIGPGNLAMHFSGAARRRARAGDDGLSARAGDTLQKEAAFHGDSG
jgi:DNA helicase-2/ATP-dependent DNA helicase PcrA